MKNIKTTSSHCIGNNGSILDGIKDDQCWALLFLHFINQLRNVQYAPITGFGISNTVLFRNNDLHSLRWW
jgi:hypothetical protein